MERMLTSEERIKRAEDIYNRRKLQSNSVRLTYNSVNNGKKHKFNTLNKMILQIILCVLIYSAFYLIKNSNYIFSEEILNRTKSILSYDIDISQIYTNICNYINQIIKKDNDKNNEFNNQTNTGAENNIGGVEPNENEDTIANNTNVQNTLPINDISSLSQMEIDGNDIKSKYKLIKPIEGTITSRFGERESTNPKVSKYHTGIDIANSIGTPIKAALDGVVKISSAEGDYGKHLKIVNGDISIIYAHCNKLYLKENDIVKQGDVIAEVGTTGNSTRTTFTF